MAQPEASSVGVRLEEDIQRRLKQVAQTGGVKPSVVIRACVRAALPVLEANPEYVKAVESGVIPTVFQPSPASSSNVDPNQEATSRILRHVSGGLEKDLVSDVEKLKEQAIEFRKKLEELASRTPPSREDAYGTFIVESPGGSKVPAHFTKDEWAEAKRAAAAEGKPIEQLLHDALVRLSKAICDADDGLAPGASENPKKAAQVPPPKKPRKHAK